jgi:hypothetical protein
MIHEGRQAAAAEAVQPDVILKTINAAIEAGQEPTRTKVRAAIKEASGRKARGKKAATEKPRAPAKSNAKLEPALLWMRPEDVPSGFASLVNDVLAERRDQAVWTKRTLENKKFSTPDEFPKFVALIAVAVKHLADDRWLVTEPIAGTETDVTDA